MMTSGRGIRLGVQVSTGGWVTTCVITLLDSMPLTPAAALPPTLVTSNEPDCWAKLNGSSPTE